MGGKTCDDTDILRTVLPGDEIIDFNPDETTERIFIGPGLRWQENIVRATRAGILKCSRNNLYYVDTFQKRYIPHRREFVIGTVIKKKGESYLVDIGASEPATISYLSFENASKKTRKEVKLGDLLYGQLLVANKDMEPEMVCIDVYSRAVGMGSLPEGGLLFNIRLDVARKIIDPQNPFLLAIAKKVNYTVVVGFNGRVWVKASNQAEMIAVMHSIAMLEVMGISEACSKVELLIDSVLAH